MQFCSSGSPVELLSLYLSAPCIMARLLLTLAPCLLLLQLLKRFVAIRSSRVHVRLVRRHALSPRELSEGVARA